jgi:flagellar motor protein MotB
MSRHRYLLASMIFASASAQSQILLEPPLGEAVERHLSGDEPIMEWAHDPGYLDTDQGDVIETREVEAEELDTIKLANLVPPIRFGSGVADIPDSTVAELRGILERMRDRRNVRLHLVGHADNQPLSPALVAVFGDNEGLSRERAGEVAELLQATLDLPPDAVSYAWMGDTQPVASNESVDGRALNRRVEVEVWYDEVRDAVALEQFLVEQQINRIKVCRMETVCKLTYVEGHAHRARVQNLIPPLHYDAEDTEVSDTFVERIRQALSNMSDKQNVIVKLVGFTDALPLNGRDERIYGDHLGLSRARARRVALAIQDALELPTAAIESDGRGAERPLGSNDTDQGRRLNRRVEVEFWYDDPLQELPDEPQICPADTGAELVTRVYDPPWGQIEPLQLEQGQPVLPPGLTAGLQRALEDVANKTRPRLRFVGYTANERLDRRTAMVYGDDIGLSAARARRTMEVIAEQMGLSAAQIESEGRGYVHSSDVINAGFVQGEDSHVVVQVVYDELAVLDDYEGVDIARLSRELSPENPFALNLMRITVDGEPIDDPSRSSADIQRCTDVAMQQADIQFGFDNLRADPRLSVSATPVTLALDESDWPRLTNADMDTGPLTQAVDRTIAGLGLEAIAAGADAAGEVNAAIGPSAMLGDFAVTDAMPAKADAADDSVAADVDAALVAVAVAEGLADSEVAADFEPPGGPVVTFSAYNNYDHFIDRTEIRIFDVEQSLRGVPLDVVEVGAEGLATWQPEEERFRAPMRELKYVLRAYGHDGTFDETSPQPLWLTWEIEEETPASDSGSPDGQSDAEESVDDEVVGSAEVSSGSETARNDVLLSGYGENELAVRNITLSSGTVTVRGSGVPADHTVLVAGQPAPIDPQGNFVTETILPTGQHTVEVAVLDPEGNGELYLRDLELKRNDWFYVGMADLTLSADSTNGPVDLLQGDNSEFNFDDTSTGRLAFFVNGKFGDQWRLVASADTQEARLDDLFSNFMNKSPESLFRRIDPDYHYPTFGDDSTVEQGAPTYGNFFVKLSQRENYGIWGNFNIGYMNNELAQVDRGLYGGNFHYESDGTTSFGEQRLALDAFTAEPGTVPSREEFRGTGGSLYFLQRQDVLPGSERVRIEIRDKASGIVTGVLNLRSMLDYDIDYLQGRILLSEPLASTANDGLLVRSNGIQGDEAYLVVRYEYTPGFEDLDSMSVGGQVHYWLNDHVKLGLTANNNDENSADTSLSAADLTVRMTEQTWVKLQTGRTEGLLASTVRSDDGGFGFYGYDDLSFADASAGASRLDVSVGLEDVLERARGRVTLYGQELEAGYAAPGLATLTDTRNYGLTVTMPVTDTLSVTAKSDTRIQEQGIETVAHEVNVGYQLDEQWDVNVGVRLDERIDNSPIVPLTQHEGERTDAVVQVGYDSLGRWSAYSFAQSTTSVTGNRDDNGRIGFGGAYQITERLGLDLEVSNGDLGAGGKIGTNYIHSDRTSLYLNYALENERTDNGLRAARGSEGNLVAGVKTRLSDTTSVYAEERYQHNDYMTGLTHATGVSLAPTERLNISASTDIGVLQDVVTGAETKRTAAGFQVGFGFDAIQFSSGIEYRQDESEQPDLFFTTRDTWLFRNSFKVQMSPSARFLGKLNHAESESSQGQFYDGGFTEAVVGFAYRPVNNDRLNALAKYTYFYNVPSAGQITLQNTAAEFIQKTQIASFDFTYDIKPRWSIGGKYAYRQSQVSLDRVDPQFFANGAQLYIVRADWEFRKDWEALAEVRLLDLTDIGEKRSGGLIVVSRYLGPNLKIGMGYNFTDFSDDLTDLSFDHQGAFVSLTGAL